MPCPPSQLTTKRVATVGYPYEKRPGGQRFRTLETGENGERVLIGSMAVQRLPLWDASTWTEVWVDQRGKGWPFPYYMGLPLR